jgi:class 3 adenylate cyclase
MDVADWLRGLGLERYEAAFRENDVGVDLLPSLTAEDLKDLGVTPVGHRRRLLEAIAALRAGSVSGGAPIEMPLPVGSADRNRSPESVAERRQLSVMFCDLVGSTELSARLDPENLREVIGGYHARVAETVGRFDGFVAKYMGDGVLVYFGYPQAHEDDAEQAVRAALAVLQAVGELPATERLQVRIGVATGLVVVGDLIGAGSAQEQAIVGETPNLAARLQALAAPGTVVLAEGTRRHIGALFEVADLGLQPLKGFAEPQRAWRVTAENLQLGRFEALRSGATPLVGREEELELLQRRWTQAKSGAGRVVLISGEAGVGKSRLAGALAERIAGDRYLRLRYFCSPHRQDSALHPIIAQMEHAAGFAREDPPPTKRAKLQALLSATTTPQEDVGLLAELLSLPCTDIAPPRDVTPQKRKEKTFAALLRQLEHLARQQPALLVFEDIHWIDPSSRELLDRLIERVEHLPALLLTTFRPEFQPSWTGQPHVSLLALARLDRDHTAAMVQDIAAKPRCRS